MASIDDFVSLVEGGYETVKGDVTVRLIDPSKDGNKLTVHAILTRDGANLPFNNPWNILNPPSQTQAGETDASSVMAEIIAGSGFFDA